MIAAVLDRLGVYLGSRADRIVFEDVEIAAAIECDPASLSSIITRYDAAHPFWAFKLPRAYQSIADNLHRFRNPRLVVTFRDPLTIAMRNVISMAEELPASLGKASADISELVNFAQNLKVPALMVSYEKALANPSRLVESVVRFCGMPSTLDRVESAKSAVINGPELYLQSSRTLPWEGFLDEVGESASGWVRISSGGNPATVVVKIDGVEVARGLADRPRSDLAYLGKGDVAFSIPLPEKPRPNARVEACIDGTDYTLSYGGASREGADND
jgi:hypothetical protein